MRTVVAWLVATVSGLALLTPVAAAPPDDVAAYCRSVYPDPQLQARCLGVENAAAERVARSAAGADRDAFDRCLGISPAWAVMESCLAQAARGGPASGTTGPMNPPAGLAPGAAGTPAPPAAEPEPAVAAAAIEPDRPTRIVSEADADRQLRGVLEREGARAARCSKKRYGPGWVFICE
jgi:hypothetical protein